MMVVQAGDSPNKRLDSGRTASYSCDSTRWTFRVTFADHIALAANAATICTAIVAVVRWALLKKPLFSTHASYAHGVGPAIGLAFVAVKMLDAAWRTCRGCPAPASPAHAGS